MQLSETLIVQIKHFKTGELLGQQLYWQYIIFFVTQNLTLELGTVICDKITDSVCT